MHNLKIHTCDLCPRDMMANVQGIQTGYPSDPEEQMPTTDAEYRE